jgi:zinc D-Ala-D-Ala carboxypeptidase
VNLTKNFTLQELTASDWAARHGVDNTPPAVVLAELQCTAELLQRIRNYLTACAGIDTPLTNISGYRSIPVNRGIGSSDGSWVHVSTKMVAKPINRIITIDRHGTRAGILQVRP